MARRPLERLVRSKRNGSIIPQKLIALKPLLRSKLHRPLPVVGAFFHFFCIFLKKSVNISQFKYAVPYRGKQRQGTVFHPSLVDTTENNMPRIVAVKLNMW